MLRTKYIEKIKTRISCSLLFFPPKSYHLWDNVENYCTAGKAIDDNMAHAHCMLDTYEDKHTLGICSTYCLPLQQWLHERPQCYVIPPLSILLCTEETFSFLNPPKYDTSNSALFIFVAWRHVQCYKSFIWALKG